MGVGFKKTPPHKHFTSILHDVVLALERWARASLNGSGIRGNPIATGPIPGPPALRNFLSR
jgi:hypothetical protein